MNGLFVFIACSLLTCPFGFSIPNSPNTSAFNDCVLIRPRNIYIFGDSHSEEFIGIPHCIYKNLGSITMHRVGRDKLEVLNFKDFPFQEGDAVVFVFGQIDVGWHICKIRDSQRRSLDEIIATLAYNYIGAIKLMMESFPNVVKIIYSITPPTNNTNIPHIPYVGSLGERVQITKQLNLLLQALAMMNGIEFLDVYDDYSYPNGVLCTETSDQSHHINRAHNSMIKKRLYEILNKYN